MTPTFPFYLRPMSAAASAVPAVNSTVRLSLSPVLDRRAAVDGAWWPYSRDAAAELPGLIAAVDRRLERTTLRIGVYPGTWNHVPRRISARGRQVKVGWFPCTDPRVITMVFAGAETVTLLIIPPGTASEPETAALTPAPAGVTRLRSEDTFAAAPGLAVADDTGTGEDGQAGWGNEAEHIAGLPVG